MGTSFREILALAKDRTPAGKRRMAGQFSQAYLEYTSQFNREERNLALDILTALMQDAALEVRRELACSLAAEPLAPHKLIVQLAHDMIEVARPVLTRSNLLLEADLLSVIRERGVDHRMVIATRPDLTTNIIDTLAKKHEIKVAEQLLYNNNITLSDDALRLITADATDNADLLDVIATRAELTADIAQRIYWIVGNELRDKIKNHFALDHALLDRALENTIAHLAHRQSDALSRRSMADRLVDSGIVNAPFLISLLKNRGTELFRDIFSSLTRLSPEIIKRLSVVSAAEALALICRGLDFNKTETATLMMLIWDKIANESEFNPAALNEALHVHGKLTRGDALTVMHQWAADPAYLFTLEERQSKSEAE